MTLEGALFIGRRKHRGFSGDSLELFWPLRGR